MGPPQQFQEHQPPQQLQEHRPPQQLQDHQPPQQLQDHQPPQQLQEHQPSHQLQDHHPLQEQHYVYQHDPTAPTAAAPFDAYATHLHEPNPVVSTQQQPDPYAPQHHSQHYSA